jgi:hypothetical protein
MNAIEHWEGSRDDGLTDQRGNHSDAPTGEDTTYDEEGNSGNIGLHVNLSREDEDSKDDGPLPTEEICDRGQ